MLTSITLTGCSDGSILDYANESAAPGDTLTDTTGLPTLGTYYFHPDHLGSISYLTDAEGNVVTRMSYTPYGEKVKSASTGPDMFHQKYTAQIDDGEESGLLYYNARYYDPVIGRFISADTMVPGAGNSQAFNRYMYVKGNSVRYNDPSGHFSMGGVISAVAGAVLGGPIGAAAGYAAYKNRNNIKNFISEHKQGIKQAILTGAGYYLGGGIGALYGYAAGSDGGIKQFWQDNQWFRITTYVLVLL